MKGAQDQFGFLLVADKVSDPVSHLSCCFDGECTYDHVPWLQTLMVNEICDAGCECFRFARSRRRQNLENGSRTDNRASLLFVEAFQERFHRDAACLMALRIVLHRREVVAKSSDQKVGIAGGGRVA